MRRELVLLLLTLFYSGKFSEYTLKCVSKGPLPFLRTILQIVVIVVEMILNKH